MFLEVVKDIFEAVVICVGSGAVFALSVYGAVKLFRSRKTVKE